MKVGRSDRTAYLAEWYRKNRAKLLERTHLRYLAKKDHIAQKNKEWRARNPDRVRANARKYRANNLELCRKRSRENNRRNKVKIAAQRKIAYANQTEEQREVMRSKSRAWIKRNPDKMTAYNKKQYAKNRIKFLADNKVWRKDNADKLREYRIKNRVVDAERTCRRRALKRGARINLSQITSWMKSIKARKKASCYWCESVVPTATIHFDHIVPLSKGGPHTIENLCVACGPCNLSKSSKPVRTWTKVNQTFLEL